MSFCATAALVALAEVWPTRPSRRVGLPWPLAALQRARDWTVAMLMVSFVAGAATGPFAIQHFNRVANYGVFANLTADLLASVVLMPALALGVLLQALGAEPRHRRAAAGRGRLRRREAIVGHRPPVRQRARRQARRCPAPRPLALADLLSGHRVRLSVARAAALDRRAHGLRRGAVAKARAAGRPGSPRRRRRGGRHRGPGGRAQARTAAPTPPSSGRSDAAFDLPADPAQAQAGHFDCDRTACAPIGPRGRRIGRLVDPAQAERRAAGRALRGRRHPDPAGRRRPA